MTTAVTAVSGHLGREIIDALVGSADQPLIGLARSPDKVKDLNVEVRPGDYAKPDQLTASLAGVETLLLVSGMAPPEERIQQHRNVIDAAKDAGVAKIVYTSVQGPEEDTDFTSIVKSNRQTEADIRESGLDWAIGRNGIYIEPDVAYIDSYKEQGEIANCAGDGKCGYTTRSELAASYACLLTQPRHNGETYDLNGEPITQTQLAALLNEAFGTQLVYRAMSVAEFRQDRTEELGPFFGPIIAGIYEGIRRGAYDHPGDFEAATGRPHQTWDAYVRSIRP